MSWEAQDYVQGKHLVAMKNCRTWHATTNGCFSDLASGDVPLTLSDLSLSPLFKVSDMDLKLKKLYLVSLNECFHHSWPEIRAYL